MGGDPKQPKTKMPEEEHKQLHRDLNDFLRQQKDCAGNHMRPQRGNSGAQIQDKFSREQLLEAAATFYRQNRNRYPIAAQDFFNQHPELKEYFER